MSSSTLIASTLPVRAAIISGLRPSGSFSLASAPASSSAAIIAASPLTLASQSGVAPSRFAAFGLAPARSSMSASSMSPRYDGPVQRGRAVVLRRVHVGLLRDQRSHGGLVAAHRRVGESLLALRPVTVTTRTRQIATRHRGC